MQRDRLNKQDFLSMLVRSFIQASRKEQGDLEQIYNGYRKLIDNQIYKRPEQEQECKQLLTILEKVYTMFNDSKFRQIIIDNNITYQQFTMEYGETLIGDNKRKYNMSDKFEPSMIASEDKMRENKKVKYIAKEGLENRYVDLEGKEVIIQKIGTLYFECWNSVRSFIDKYKISRQVSSGLYQEDEVFSNIKIANMQNPQYREVVLGELLSENNINLSKVGGYIGEIAEISTSDSEFKVGTETTIGTDYFYRINPKYALTYKSEDLAAVMFQKQTEKKQQSKENEYKETDFLEI